MKSQMMKKLLGMVALASASTFMVVACGDDSSSDCGADQRKAIYAGVEGCYDLCDSGACGTGYTCDPSGLCVPAGGNNSTNNANNTTTNNNTTPVNNATCTPSSLASGVCDPLCQTGCVGDQACVAGGNPPVSACQPAGPGTAGAVCNNMALCAKGFGCLIESAGATSGVCREYCKPGDATACGAGETCAPLLQDLSLGACAPVSDACTVVPNSCPTGEMCYNTTVGLRCVAHSPTAMVGDACTTPTGCGNNMACIGTQGGGATCQLLCSTTQPCPDNKTCNPLADENGNMLPYGACAL
jgi:hypothetical protein